MRAGSFRRRRRRLWKQAPGTERLDQQRKIGDQDNGERHRLDEYRPNAPLPRLHYWTFSVKVRLCFSVVAPDVSVAVTVKL